MPKKTTIQDLSIQALSSESAGIGKLEDMVVFVKGALPGDVVDAEIFKKKSSYAQAHLLAIKKNSTHRVEPFCEHFGVCGGCTLQHLSYAEQLKHKQQQVEDALLRIAKVPFPPLSPILASDQTVHYRNKLEFSFSQRRWLTQAEIESGKTFSQKSAGFHVPQGYDKVFQVNHCHLQPPYQNQIRNALFEFALQKGFDFYQIREKYGFLRCLTLRCNQKDEWMAIVQFFEDKPKEIKQTMDFLQSSFSKIKSLFYTINPKGNDTIYDLDLRLWSGEDHLLESLEDLSFRIGPKSFFQVNINQTLAMYRQVRLAAELTGQELVYDLYTGTGTIALFLARNAHKVIGIEWVAQAIEDAKQNALLNNITNAEFFASDIKQALNQDFISKNGKPDVLIADPPRSGIEEKVLPVLLELSPKKIIYVSCNPSTQARDVAYLSGSYKISKVQPLDMFPHTHHVENILVLDRNF
jgi:23S rRNA (uracil1939-C5)-methyltransferase